MDKALLLVETVEASTVGCLEKALAVFGIASRRLTVPEFLADLDSVHDGAKLRLLGVVSSFLKLVETLDKNRDVRLNWQKRVHSAAVFATNDSTSLEKLAQLIADDSEARLTKVAPGSEWTVSRDEPDFCQSMSGIKVAAKGENEFALVFGPARTRFTKIISADAGSALTQLDLHGVAVFLSTAGVIDVEAPLSGRFFDVRMHFLQATPVVLYAKWAFADMCWQSPEATACLVIDDPLLTPRYGQLNYQNLLDLMERDNFSTSIAFIPWNWNRSAKKIVQMFRENPKRLSLSIHGCDHTASEFGSRNPGRLAWKSKEATQRMARHRLRTGLSHDPVMIFPHGAFSEASMAVLKRGDFIGVVNSEVISKDPQPRPIRVADYWNGAVMNYSQFPIFTRRYAWAGVENFAFDILLGKPCILVAHHHDCHHQCRHVDEFVQRLNKLNARLHWTNLAEVVRRGFHLRQISPEATEVEMFGSEIRLENLSKADKVFICQKLESETAAVKEIRAADQPVPWTAAHGRIFFEVTLAPGENKIVAITYSATPDDGFCGESLKYRVNAMMRRYLCEFRENYLRQGIFLKEGPAITERKTGPLTGESD